MNLTKSTAIGHVQAGWVDKGAVEINAMVWVHLCTEEFQRASERYLTTLYFFQWRNVLSLRNRRVRARIFNRLKKFPTDLCVTVNDRPLKYTHVDS